MYLFSGSLNSMALVGWKELHRSKLLPGSSKVFHPDREKNSAFFENSVIFTLFEANYVKRQINIRYANGFKIWKWCEFNKTLTKILRPVFGRFCQKTAAVCPPTFLGQNLFFLGPVLSFFAEFSPGWQQKPESVCFVSKGPNTGLDNRTFRKCSISLFKEQKVRF